MHPILQRQLNEVMHTRRMVRLRQGTAWLLFLLGGIALLLWALRVVDETNFGRVALGLAAVLVAGSLIVRVWCRPRMDLMGIAREIEAQHPELSATLLTAIEQQAGDDGFGYMQERVIEEAVVQAVRLRWSEAFDARELHRASWMRAAALSVLVAGVALLMQRAFFERTANVMATAEIVATTVEPSTHVADFDIEVTPGDTEIESGSRLVVQAKFAKDLPPEATLVMCDAKGLERQRMAMRATVDATVFGGVVGNIKTDGLYRVEFDGGRSKDFKITTFVHPELVRSDAKITPPDYAKQPVKEIKNTLKVTALEGSRIGWTMKVNKPMKQAELFADKDHIIALKSDANDATTLVAEMQPDQSRKYRLHLVDDHERGNKTPPWFHITVLSNQLPKIEVAFPKRDAKVSPLQELPLEARVSDDLGVEKAGAVIQLADATREVPLPLNASAAGKKFEVKTLLNLEPEKVEPLQMVSYYFWAEDKGPRGETRRAMSDMFFAEVRAFEDIFREQEPPAGEEPGDDEPKSPTGELLKIQKDIVNANWHLMRDQLAGKELKGMKADVDTVMVSQATNDEKATKAIEKVKDAKVKQALVSAQQEMKAAMQTLGRASDAAEAKALSDALAPEQRALRWLYTAQSNEHNVTKANPKSPPGKQSKPQDQELNDLELKQKDQRYEEEKAATAEKTKEQEENLTVLNRLKELARRQEALAQKMKELEQQLAQAKAEDAKEELANQLKRLQDEQEQLLRDLDDTRDKMEQSPNAANMADAKEKLDETREKVSDALEQMKQEKLAQAGTSAARAQKELEQARDDFRQRTAKRFSEEMKAMRDAARELEKEQQKLADALEKQPVDSKTKTDGSNPFDTSEALKKQLSGAETARQIDAQNQRAKKLMDDMKRISEQAEESEPLLHKHLYEALRSAQTEGLEDNLTEASNQVRYGDRNSAQDAERRAGKAVTQLKDGVNKAADSVLGNESEALRIARNELDKLIDEARASQGTPSPDGKKAGAEAKPPKAPQAGQGKQVADGKSGEGKDKQDPAGKGQGKAPVDAAQGKAGEGKGTPSEKADSKGIALAGKRGEGTQPGQQAGTAPDKDSKSKGQAKGGKSGEGNGTPSDSSQVASSGQQPGDAPGRGGQPMRGDLQVTQGSNDGGGGGGGRDWFFDAPTEVADNSALVGDGFVRWSDRLRNLGDVLTQPELRNEAAKVLDHARAVRAEFRTRVDLDMPQADYLAARILSPLIELRDKVTEELARREGGNPLSPVDRDPVPEAYRELVSRYYQQLGAGK